MELNKGEQDEDHLLPFTNEHGPTQIDSLLLEHKQILGFQPPSSDQRNMQREEQTIKGDHCHMLGIN